MYSSYFFGLLKLKPSKIIIQTLIFKSHLISESNLKEEDDDTENDDDDLDDDDSDNDEEEDYVSSNVGDYCDEKD